MEDDDERVGTALTRRGAIATLGTPALVWFAGCSGSTGETDGDRTTTGSTGTTTAAAGAPGDSPTATGRRTDSTASGATATDGDARTTTDEAGTTAGAETTTGEATTTERTTTTDDGPPTAPDGNACVVRPELAEGPFYVDEDLRRSDVRVDTSTGERVAGIPLELQFTVYGISEDSCSRLQDAAVDVWQCDAFGNYSGEPSEGTEGQDFLRGTQVTDQRGRASFTTIYPGWYPSRTPHVHFKVRSETDGDAFYHLTSQLFFRDERTDEVYQRAPYDQRPERDTTNEEDQLYEESVSELVLDVERTDEGYAATFDLALHTY